MTRARTVVQTGLHPPLVDRTVLPSLHLPHLAPVLLDGDVGPVVGGVGPGEAGADVREAAAWIENR